MPATVSFILPVHDAALTIEEALVRVARADLGQPELRREIIVVDDASTDGTGQYLRQASADGAIRTCFHPEHLGQGAALSTGLAIATGQIVVVVDPTLAYDPAECGRLLAPILVGEADVVYGSRYVAAGREIPGLLDRVADQVLTTISNGLTSLALSDVTSPYKAFRADVVRGAILRADGPGVAAELASLFATRRCRIFEAPVSYRVRHPEPATVRWMDGLSNLTMMARCRLRSWQLHPVTPHQPFRRPALAPARRARLTRLVRPIDIMPMPRSLRPNVLAS